MIIASDSWAGRQSPGDSLDHPMPAAGQAKKKPPDKASRLCKAATTQKAGAAGSFTAVSMQSGPNQNADILATQVQVLGQYRADVLRASLTVQRQRHLDDTGVLSSLLCARGIRHKMGVVLVAHHTYESLTAA